MSSLSKSMRGRLSLPQSRFTPPLYPFVFISEKSALVTSSVSFILLMTRPRVTRPYSLRLDDRQSSIPTRTNENRTSHVWSNYYQFIIVNIFLGKSFLPASWDPSDPVYIYRIVWDSHSKFLLILIPPRKLAQLGEGWSQ